MCNIHYVCIYRCVFLYIHIRQYCVYVRPHHRSQSRHMSSLLSSLYIEVSYDCHLSVIELSGRSILQFLVRNLSCCHRKPLYNYYSSCEFLLFARHTTSPVVALTLNGNLWFLGSKYLYEKRFWRVEVGCQVLSWTRLDESLVAFKGLK